jgi:hypothetical protein
VRKIISRTRFGDPEVAEVSKQDDSISSRNVDGAVLSSKRSADLFVAKSDGKQRSRSLLESTHA